VDGTQTIPFKGLSSRYVRVRIADSKEKFPVHGLSVLQLKNPEVRRAPIGASFSPETSADQTVSVWRADIASANQPVSEVAIVTDSPEFYRALRVSGSEDGQEWSWRGSGVIYRYAQAGKNRESLRVQLPEFSANRFLRVEIINGNDQALANVVVSLSAIPRTVVFKPNSGQQYRVVYGNERAQHPQYDLSHFLQSGDKQPAYPAATLGAEEVTANYRDPRPFTERHPQVLWTALVVAIVLIGLTALKTLRTSATTQK
jgi:hypothetical protein